MFVVKTGRIITNRNSELRRKGVVRSLKLGVMRREHTALSDTVNSSTVCHHLLSVVSESFIYSYVFLLVSTNKHVRYQEENHNSLSLSLRFLTERELLSQNLNLHAQVSVIYFFKKKCLFVDNQHGT